MLLMKTRFVYTLFVLITITFISCGKADLNPCYDTNCLEGEYCLDGACIETANQTSLSFIDPPVPNKVFITGLVINKFPLIKSSGQTWDSGSLPNSAPDLLISVKQGSFVTLWENTAPYTNTNQLPLVINLTSPIEITQVKALTSINFYDFDSNTFSDFMGGIFFTPYGNGNNYPDKVILNNTLIIIELDLTYEFN